MKDFTFRNDTRLFFCNDIRATVAGIAKGKKVMVVYGGGSVKQNGCFNDITGTLTEAGIPFVEYGGSSREFEKIEEGIRMAKANGVTMIIGAGGASVMDSAKLSIEQSRKEAEKNLRDEVSRYALAIASQVTRDQLRDVEAQKRLVNSLLDEIEKKN